MAPQVRELLRREAEHEVGRFSIARSLKDCAAHVVRRNARKWIVFREEVAPGESGLLAISELRQSSLFATPEDCLLQWPRFGGMSPRRGSWAIGQADLYSSQVTPKKRGAVGRLGVDAGFREVLAAGLEARRDEIEGVFRACVNSISSIDEIRDVEYTEGLKLSISKAFDFGLAGIAGSKHSVPEIPVVLLAQARLAARNGLNFSVVQRRYMDCYHLLDEFLIDEAEKHGPQATGAVRYIRRTTKRLFDELLDAVGAEYSREHKRPSSPEQRRVALVKDLLDCKPVDPSELMYDFNVFHLGLIARGPTAANAIKGLGKALDCLPLVVRLDDEAVWGWLGRRERTDPVQLKELIASRWPRDTPLGIGETGEAMGGWRTTHHQASGAFPLALRKPDGIFHYADDPLLVTIAQDDLQVARLRENYLVPLAEERDGGAKLLAALRAYIAADRNASSAAAALDVARQTVLNRLATVERRVGRPLADCLAELEVALRLDELGRIPEQI